MSTKATRFTLTPEMKRFFAPKYFVAFMVIVTLGVMTEGRTSILQALFFSGLILLSRRSALAAIWLSCIMAVATTLIVRELS